MIHFEDYEKEREKEEYWLSVETSWKQRDIMNEILREERIFVQKPPHFSTIKKIFRKSYDIYNRGRNRKRAQQSEAQSKPPLGAGEV